MPFESSAMSKEAIRDCENKCTSENSKAVV